MCAGESHSILSLLGAYQISLADGVRFYQRHSSPLSIFTTETRSIEALLQPTVKEETFVGEKFRAFSSKTFGMEFKFVFSN